MTTIINSLKGTHWFKVAIGIIIYLLFLILPLCQKDELSQQPILKMDNMSPSTSSQKVKLTGKVKDVDGNWYNTVKIGDQWWMVDNLKTTKYNDKTPIPNVTDNLAWAILSTGAYCWYDNNISNKAVYGAMYNWHAVEDSRKLCPSGWHVPSSGEWVTLENFLGGYIVAGGKLKEAGTAHWLSPNLDATNESGFTALPAGDLINGTFENLSTGTFFWSSSPSFDIYHAAYRELDYQSGVFYNCCVNPKITDALSVRCLKD